MANEPQPMPPELYREVRALFDRALDRPEPERRAFVEAACKGRPEVLAEVRRLLDARGRAHTFLEDGPGRVQTVGRYVIVGELGRGTMGTVYDAIDPLIERRIALKVIRCDALAADTEAGSSRERLLREVRAAGSLLHPGIVVVFDVGQEGDTAFFAMERVEGTSLRHVLDSGSKVPCDQALDLVRQAAAALDYAHRQGIVHRDIKAANILLAGGGAVKLVDFSIAKIASAQHHTAAGMIWGTPACMSPEQIQGQPVDGKSDQFSLALVAYELMTGAAAFRADSLAAHAALVVCGPRPSAHAANPGLPPPVDEVFCRALAALPGDRYASCAEFAEALTASAVGGAAARSNPAVMPEPPEPKSRSAGRARRLASVALMVAILALAAGLYYRFSARPKPAPPAPVSRVVAAPMPVERPSADRVKTVTAADRVTEARQLYDQSVARNDPGLLRRAAEMGLPAAMVSLGETCLDSHREQDAVGWFRRAADAGDVPGMLRLGGMYQVGIGVPQNDSLAVHWFRRASDAGDPSATFDLGEMYENGRGVSRDLQKAKELYRKAAAQGNSEATAALVRLK